VLEISGLFYEEVVDTYNAYYKYGNEFYYGSIGYFSAIN